MTYTNEIEEVNLLEKLDGRSMLFKFIITADAKQSIFRDLDLMGINEKTLFPGLDGIGQYIEKKNRRID